MASGNQPEAGLSIRVQLVKMSCYNKGFSWHAEIALLGFVLRKLCESYHLFV